jgi:uncharacterized protein (DUF58 family)
MAAYSHMARGERQRAIDVSALAQRMQPTNSRLLLARAEMLAQLSACAPLREVVARLEHSAHDTLPRDLQQQLRTQSMDCRDPAPPRESAAAR